MRKIGHFLVNTFIALGFCICVAGAIAESSVGFLMGALVFVGWFIFNIKKTTISKEDRKILKEVNTKYSNNEWHKIGEFAGAYLYVNEKDKKFNTSGKEYQFKDLISVEIMEDEKQWTGGFVSNNSFGGARISSGQLKFCKKLQLKLVLNSVLEPQTYITFINKRTWKDRKKYKRATDMAQKFLSTLQVIISNK